MYTANKYVTNEPSDFSNTQVPTLKTTTNGTPSEASTNEEKVKALTDSFFPPPPPVSSIPQPFEYPNPIPGIRLFFRCRIQAAVKLLKPYKAPGPDGIPNIILSKCIDALIDHLYFIYRAVLEHDVYHERWLTSTTLVLCKIDKPAYDVAKALDKLLSTLVTADLSHLAKKYHMLPPRQFGGCPG